MASTGPPWAQSSRSGGPNHPRARDGRSMDENPTFEEVVDALWLRGRKKALGAAHFASIAGCQYGDQTLGI